MPSKDQVKQAVNVLLRSAKYGNGKKTQMSEPGFSGLVSDVNTELEKLGHDTLARKDEKTLAEVIYADYRSSFMEVGGKIGPYMAVQLGSLSMAAAVGSPDYTDLNQQFQATKQDNKAARSEATTFLGIRDAGHSFHGSNFSGSQTLRQIIDNVFQKVQGEAERERVAANSRKYYGYDPITKM